MSLFDTILNGAADKARASAAAYDRSNRRRVLASQVAGQQSAITEASTRIGRLAIAASDAGRSLPDSVAPAADAVRRWKTEIKQLEAELAAMEARGASPEPPPAAPGVWGAGRQGRVNQMWAAPPPPPPS
jgi:hypothetical protein